MRAKKLCRLALLPTLASLLVVAPTALAAHWVPPPRLTWYWQLTGRIRNSVDAAAYDIDGFDTNRSEVAALHRLGRQVVCYVDVGTWENWRPDAGRFPRSVLGDKNGWPGERWLDIRRPHTGFRITAKNQLAYDEWIAKEAHRLGPDYRFSRYWPALPSLTRPVS